MPVVHKSTIRRARQSEKRRLRNRATISSVRSILRKVQDAIAAKKPDEAKATLQGSHVSA
jgi:small subunit ribosomal protein S20